MPVPNLSILERVECIFLLFSSESSQGAAFIVAGGNPGPQPFMTALQGTDKICLLKEEFVILRFFSIYFAITGDRNIVPYTQDFDI